jgi:hypothetical protein
VYIWQSWAREREREGDIMQELALDLTCSGHKMATVQKL